MTPIVIATANPHKVREPRAILAEAGVPAVGLADLGPPPPEPAELGTTFLENATTKAVAYARWTGRACLADDSGLEVDALGGAPGVASAHYAEVVGADQPRSVRDAANTARVLAELGDTPPERRGARFTCVMVLASEAGEVLASARGVLEGRIGMPGDVPRGAHGFGYDPIFLVAPNHAHTSAEWPPEVKNRRSHRALAAREIARRISALGLA